MLKTMPEAQRARQGLSPASFLVPVVEGEAEPSGSAGMKSKVVFGFAALKRAL